MARWVDYKWRQVVRNGVETIATVAFYEGEDVAVTDPLTGETTQYRRTALTERVELRFRGDVPDERLRVECNARLAARATPQRPARPEQRVQP